jgi:hypothetical protein
MSSGLQPSEWIFAMRSFVRVTPGGASRKQVRRDILFNGHLRAGLQRLQSECGISTPTPYEAMSDMQAIANEASEAEWNETGETPPDAIMPGFLQSPVEEYDDEAASECEPETELILKPGPVNEKRNKVKRTRTTPQMDMFRTPDAAILAIMLEFPLELRPTADRKIVVWDPFAGTGVNPFGRVLRSLGYTVLESDIQTCESLAPTVQGGLDFFARTADGKPVVPTDTNGVALHFDGIITNPAYSTKTEFLRRLLELDVWWTALLPLDTMESKRRAPIFAEMPVRVHVAPNRINYETATERAMGTNRVKATASVPFNTSWFSRFPGGKQIWTNLCDVPRVPFTIDPTIVQTCFRDTEVQYTVYEVATRHVDYYYPGLKLTAGGKVLIDHTKGSQKKRTQGAKEIAKLVGLPDGSVARGKTRSRIPKKSPRGRKPKVKTDSPWFGYG